MSEICELEDLTKACCVNCFNGLPNYGCPKQEEESKALRELVHKKALERDARVWAEAIDELLKNSGRYIVYMDKYCDFEGHAISLDNLKLLAKQIKERKNDI